MSALIVQKTVSEQRTTVKLRSTCGTGILDFGTGNPDSERPSLFT
jgi:hypothetical protein